MMLEKNLKNIAAVCLAIGTIGSFSVQTYKRIASIDEGIKKLNNVSIVIDEHKKFISANIDYDIDWCLNEIAEGRQVPKIMLDKLVSLRDNMKGESITYKQKINIDYIERRTNYK